ncbi:hypothetical protein [Actinotalea sp. K2]|uniref:hypothetical protein n=1 Tax=Actinotalea sp. K2 TaxID=2939438 RepID=UPI00201776C3|nr:hypothetical protein [Actinotalea sp. K2]MCL3862661.1 hypothetical protein [Actinotalea sp. K2]
MRWDALFTDMELQLESAAAQELAAEVADRTRTERATVLLADRLRACLGDELSVVVRSGATVLGEVRDVSPSWVVLTRAQREHLVPLSAVASISGLRSSSAPPADAVLRRLGLGHALRAVARDRSVVRVVAGGALHQGRVEVVGADHLELAVTFDDTARPTGVSVVLTFEGLEVLSTS